MEIEDMDGSNGETEMSLVETLTQFHPPNLWGLDFHFKMFSKFYIGDILAMKPYPKFQGAWAYKNHPIYKVDVLGIVVKVAQNSKCFMFSVDDGTGIVTCCCWKDSFSPSTKSVAGCQFEDLPGALRKKADELLNVGEDSDTGYQLGDLINVRGQIKMFREEKEIVASFHILIQDPMVEVLRMCEMPGLYRQGYDRPFQLPDRVKRSTEHKGQGDIGQSEIVTELKEAILDHLTQTTLVEVVPSDFLKVKQIRLLLDRHKTKVGPPTSCADEIGHVIQALQLLGEEGKITARSDRRMLFEVLLHDSKLEKRILQILVTETSKPKFSERGCHYQHIAQELHQTFQYAKVKPSAVLHCLQKLEVQSDCFRTTKFHYLPCSV